MTMTPSQRLLIAINLSVTAMSVMQGYYRYYGSTQSPLNHPVEMRKPSSPSVFNFFSGSKDAASALPPCPNPNFMRKHLCEFCTTDKDAFDFSHRRIQATNVNSVMFGYPGFKSEGRHCVNLEPVKVVTCTMSTGRCMALGEKCVLQHDATDGNLDYHNITCG